MSCSERQSPQDRNDFRIAIICALPSEAEKVELIFDEEWSKKYGKASGDTNTYTTGRIGEYNVVLTYLSGMGANAATETASGIRASYRRIQFAFVVGICGVMPIHPETQEEIVLGDCIISTSMVQYDFGRQYPQGFIRKQTLEDSLGRANPEIRSFLAKLKVTKHHRQLSKQLIENLHAVQQTEDGLTIKYPGSKKDRLFESTYQHIHRSAGEKCDKCSEDGICGKSCESIGCEATHLVKRERLVNIEVDCPPKVHFGRIGCANTVLKSAEDRDRLSEESQLAAFEMEGSGVWDILPTIVIKSACDYADSHKNKDWQPYAATTAAVGLKAVLEQLELSDMETPSADRISQSLSQISTTLTSVLVERNIKPSTKVLRVMPFIRDAKFAGREALLKDLLSQFGNRPPTSQLRLALLGMGGVGKSQIAIELAYRIMDQDHARFSIFWVYAGTKTRFEQSYRDIATHAKLSIDKDTPILETVHQWLSDENNGRWIMIVDNVDDDQTFTTARAEDGKMLRDFLPTVSHGFILITARSQTASYELVGDMDNVIVVKPMGPEESIQLLETKVIINEDSQSDAQELVKILEYLPLAISHAGAYISARKWKISQYLKAFQSAKYRSRLLKDASFLDPRRDGSAARTVLATWQMSFETVKSQSPSAADLLCFMSMFDHSSIPKFLLRNVDGEALSNVENDENENSDNIDDLSDPDLDLDDHLTLLTTYSLVTINTDNSSVKLHHLVQLSAIEWLNLRSESKKWQVAALKTLTRAFPGAVCLEKGREAECLQLLPHAKLVLTYDIANPSHALQSKVELLIGLGEYLMDVQKFTEALSYAELAAKLSEEYLGVENKNTARALRLYAMSLIHCTQSEEAERLAQKSLAIALKLNMGVREIVYTLLGLSYAYSSLSMLGEAASTLREALEMSRTALGPEDEDTVALMLELGEALVKLGEYSEAEMHLRHCMEIIQRIWSPNNRVRFLAMVCLTNALTEQSKLEEAEKLCHEALQGFVTSQGSLSTSDGQTRWVLVNALSVVLAKAGKLEEAEIYCREGIEQLDHMHGPRYRDTLLAKSNLGVILVAMNRYEEAENILRQTLETCIEALGEKHLVTILCMGSFGSALSNQKKYDEAESILMRTVNLLTSVWGASHHKTLEGTLKLAKLYELQGRVEDFETLYLKAIELCTNELGSDSPTSLMIMEEYASSLTKQATRFQDGVVKHRELLMARKRI